MHNISNAILVGMPIDISNAICYYNITARGNTPSEGKRETHSQVGRRARTNSRPGSHRQLKGDNAMSMNELNATARDLMGVRAMIEELQAEAEALTDKLKAAMVEQGTEALQPVKIYIAGKITGDKKYRAKFREAAKALEALGHVVLNPAILPAGLEERDYMRITLAMLEAADEAVFLPDYQESAGAMIEWAGDQRRDGVRHHPGERPGSIPPGAGQAPATGNRAYIESLIAGHSRALPSSSTCFNAGPAMASSISTALYGSLSFDSSETTRHRFGLLAHFSGRELFLLSSPMSFSKFILDNSSCFCVNWRRKQCLSNSVPPCRSGVSAPGRLLFAPAATSSLVV